jgi:hypothetical protein
VLEDHSVQHCKRHETEANSNPSDRFEGDTSPIEKRIQAVLDYWTKDDASYLVQTWYQIVWYALCFHLLCLGNEIVLHLVETDVEYHEQDPNIC